MLLLNDDSFVVARPFLYSFEGLEDSGNLVEWSPAMLINRSCDSTKLQTRVSCYEVEYLSCQSGVTQEA